MKTLIVYYSFSSNNELLASHLQQRLGCDLYKIEEMKPRNGITIFLDLLFKRTPKIRECSIQLDTYDHFVLIAPVWAGKIAPPMKSFLEREKASINSYSFITLCGGREGQKEWITSELTRILYTEPEKVTELWVNDLLDEKQKNTVKSSSGYRIDAKDLEFFSTEVDDFIERLQVSEPVL